MMQQRELELFLDLAQTLHFGKTSKNCNISPSALSRAIRRLEEGVGATLLLRDNRSVELTEAGRRVQRVAAETVEQWKGLLAELNQHDTAGLRGEVRIYASVTACYSILPGVLQEFRREYPEVHIHLRTGDPAFAIDTVLDEEADIAVAAFPNVLPDPLISRVMTTTPLLPVAPRMECAVQEQVEERPIRWGAIPFVLSERGLARQRIDRWFRAEGIEPEVYAQVSGNEAILAMVALGCGVGIVPGLVMERSPLRKQVQVIDQGPELEPYRVGVTSRKKRLGSAPVRAFWSVVEGHALSAEE
jgi:LysR family positive regulator for ilvC